MTKFFQEVSGIFMMMLGILSLVFSLSLITTFSDVAIYRMAGVVAFMGVFGVVIGYIIYAYEPEEIMKK